MVRYEKEQAEEVINYFSETLVGKLSELLEFTNVCDGENLNKDLEKDALFQRDLKSIISYSIPYIPMVGLVCGGIIITKHCYMGKEDKGKDVVDTPHPKDKV